MNHERSMMLGCAVSLLLVAAASFGQNGDSRLVDEAVAAAESWLGVVDAGGYGESWDQAAELFKAALSKTQWEQSLKAVRRPLGDVVSREVESAMYATELPSAPDGQYVVIRFTTVFANKQSAVETVTPMRDPDGAWRVSGYYIK